MLNVWYSDLSKNAYGVETDWTPNPKSDWRLVATIENKPKGLYEIEIDGVKRTLAI